MRCVLWTIARSFLPYLQYKVWFFLERRAIEPEASKLLLARLQNPRANLTLPNSLVALRFNHPHRANQL